MAGMQRLMVPWPVGLLSGHEQNGIVMSRGRTCGVKVAAKVVCGDMMITPSGPANHIVIPQLLSAAKDCVSVIS